MRKVSAEVECAGLLSSPELVRQTMGGLRSRLERMLKMIDEDSLEPRVLRADRVEQGDLLRRDDNS